MIKLGEVIEIVNKHYGEKFRYTTSRDKEGLSCFKLYKDEELIMDMRTSKSDEELAQRAFELFIRYIAGSKEIYKRHICE